MNPKLEAILKQMSPRNRRAVEAGLYEYVLGKDTLEIAEEDFLSLARMIANQDPDALAVVAQPCFWSYATQLLANLA